MSEENHDPSEPIYYTPDLELHANIMAQKKILEDRAKIGDQTKSIEIMKSYLMMKFEQEDWHGVSDAANDLREMVARLEK